MQTFLSLGLENRMHCAGLREDSVRNPDSNARRTGSVLR